MVAVGITTINLIFCAGGALVILPPSPYRIAVLRFEDAKSVKEERQCVIANKASRIAYQTARSEEHTSELQSLMRISYAVFCLKKKIKKVTCNYANVRK